MHRLSLSLSHLPSAPGYRLLNGEGDLLPGLVCDVYGDTAVIKLDGDGPSGFYDVQGIAAWLQQQLQLAAVFLKYRCVHCLRMLLRMRAQASEKTSGPVHMHVSSMQPCGGD